MKALQQKEKHMFRMVPVSVLTLAALAGWSSSAQAQVFVRAPFVRVWVGGGGGVQVRAPFVNLWIPGGPPPYYYAPYPPPAYMPPVQPTAPPASQVPPTQQPQEETLPPAKPIAPAAPQTPSTQLPQEETLPPPQATAQTPLSLGDFAKTFQAREGSYQVSIINPVTKAATPVRFSLPQGTPKRVVVRGNEVEFFYGRRHFVRINFDEDGAVVTSR
jgi:hypothetical protein